MISKTSLQLFCVSLFLCASCATKQPVDKTAKIRGITVLASWDAKSPARAVAQLAAPLEAELAKIKGVSRIITRCDENGCSLLLQHDSSIRSYNIAFQANIAIKRSRNKLPEGARTIVYTTDAHRPPDLIVAVILDVKELKAEHYLATLDFANRLMRIPSTVRYEIPGMPKKKTFIGVKPARAEKFGVSLAEIARAIDQRIITIDDYTRIIIGHRRGEKGDVGNIVLKKVGRATIRIRDVANVRTVMTPAIVHQVNGEPAVLINIFLRSGATLQEVMTCLKRILKQKRPALAKRIIPINIVSSER